MTAPILVADIGGTNARFGLASTSGGEVLIEKIQSFRAVDFETVRDAADAYLESVAEKPKQACFAAAGPIVDNAVKFTNSHWQIQADDIQGPLELATFRLINDFFALASGISALDPAAMLAVKSGAPLANAPKLVIGPGTGLGQALIVPVGEQEVVVPTEGGHVSFAPRTEEEIDILKFIMREHPRVSVERLLSGRGLVNIHRALCAMTDVPLQSLQANEITAAAVTGDIPMAAKAVDMFCSLLGRVAGDAVLATGARGGVVLGGGILPKIKDVFLESNFVERFIDKGRMTDYVDAVPVNLIIGDSAALYGAAVVMRAEG